ncbi:ABC transporter ATP-binding protein, partial [Escherichia coli]|nr:ABC transporter ATP-binding protein [Escherichia coli]
EPTENLDNVSVDYLSNFIRQSDKRYIIVSHDRHFVSKTCENHYMINEKTLQKYEID